MRFNRLDLNLLVALDALLTERSVTKAALRLNLSPSATSDALSRLRDYFGDDLLVQVGRRMEPTPRAEALQQAVRDVLVRVDSTIAMQPSFDATQSERVFKIFTSDYTQLVVGPRVMAAVAAQQGTVKFEFLPQVDNPQRDLERGEADLLVLPRPLMSPDHPHEVMYEERFVCVVWAGSRLAQEPQALTLERYLAEAHVIMRPQAVRASAFEDAFIKRLGVSRRVAATSYSFAPMPGLLVGTELIATLHARLARLLMPVWPLAILPCPIAIPPMEQAIQWHKYRTQDEGIVWLRGLFRQAGAAVATAQF
ncbi:LysR family transcriptional regulator [Roseateles sp. LYH14W]|uniref:LysR family transcriptional regulator n=1 Tax=Pelomonas parva TaxID=3299032 RepID=A0ABW7EXE7_9BURK